MPLRSLIKRKKKKKTTLFNELKEGEEEEELEPILLWIQRVLLAQKGQGRDQHKTLHILKEHQNIQPCSSTMFSHSEILQLSCNQFQLVMIQQLKISITV